MERTCDHCGTIYKRPPSLIGRYCTRACAYAARVRTPAERTSYRMLRLPDHPLADLSGLVPEHRAIVYERLGPGPQACHWCDALVEWRPGDRTAAGALIVDHLDGDITNNDPANLVAACQACNGTRWHWVDDDEPHIVRKNGARLRGIERPCETCGKTFVAAPDPRPGSGRFCSRSCARKAPRRKRRLAS